MPLTYLSTSKASSLYYFIDDYFQSIVCVYVSMYVYTLLTYTYMYMYIYTHMCVYIYIHLHMYVYIYSPKILGCNSC